MAPLRLESDIQERVDQECVVCNPKGVRLRDLHVVHEKLCKSSKNFSSIPLVDTIFEFVLLPQVQDEFESSSKGEGEGSDTRSKGCLCDIISKVSVEEVEEEVEEEGP